MKLQKFRRLFIILLVLLANSPAVRANPDALGWFMQLFHPQPPPPRPAIKRAPSHKLDAKPRVTRSRPGPITTSKEIEKPKIAPTTFVAVFGDGLAQMLSQGLVEVMEPRPEIAVLHKTQDNSGLVRADVMDWNQTIQNYLSNTAKLDAGVILIGSNDRQPVSMNGKSFEVLSSEWSNLYSQRIEAIAKQFNDKKIPLIWVGLPIMKSDAASKDATALNQLFKEHAEKFGATFIDIWESFADEHGLFDAYGPDVNGETIRLRRSDGVYFTRAGARKLAHFVELEIRRQLDKLALPNQPEAVGPQPEPQSSPATEPPPTIAAKPPIGPVLPLTGHYSDSSGSAINTEAKALIQHVLQEGKALEPKKGRADDFSLP